MRKKEQMVQSRQVNQTGTINPSIYEVVDKPVSTVAVVGLGYVGLPLAIAAAERGMSVIGFDIDSDKVQRLTKREASFLSHPEQLAFRNATIQVVSDFKLLHDATIFFICVPTPVYDDHLPDLSPLIDASRTVAAALKNGDIVIVESSVNPGVCDDVIIPILEFESDLTVEKDFYFAYCPERINPGDVRYNTKNIPRVIGATGPESLDRALIIYHSILDAPLTKMKSLKEAEAVKMVENSFRDVNIAFVNELAMAFDLEGIDIVNVINAAATKPFGFMPFYPGCGVGGHCIPVDPYYLIHYGLKHGFTHHLLIAAREINNYMPHYTFKTLQKALYCSGNSLASTTIAVLGLSYKRGIGDIRESPAIALYDELKKAGASVRAFDPHVPALSTVSSLSSALKGAKAVVITTDHEEFQKLEPDIFELYGVEIVVDARNALNKEKFADSPVSYYGIGR